MRRRLTLTALTAASLLGLLAPALATVTATAASDHIPPTVHLDPWAHPLVGSQVGIFEDAVDGITYWSAGFQIDWTASDASGICSQEVGWSSYDALGSDIDPHTGGPTIFEPVSPDTRSFVGGSDFFDWQRVEDRFVVKVTDCAGNTSFSNVADSEFGVHEDTDQAISYQGRWRVSGFDDAAGGTTHATSKRGASAQITFASDGPIALIMATGPDRGEADVYVDGVLRATVDTSSAEIRQRVVVWQDRFPSGTHTLLLVNRATQKHPRIDLDVISVCPGEGSCLA